MGVWIWLATTSGDFFPALLNLVLCAGIARDRTATAQSIAISMLMKVRSEVRASRTTDVVPLKPHQSFSVALFCGK